MKSNVLAGIAVLACAQVITAAATDASSPSPAMAPMAMTGEPPIDAIFASGFECGDGFPGCAGPTTVYTDRATFLENIPPGAYENGFDDVFPGAAKQLVYSKGGISYTVSADPGLLYSDPGVIATDDELALLVITFFGEPVTAIGGNFWATNINFQPTGTEVTITLSDGTIETFVSTGPSDFRGFISQVPIDMITIDAPNGPNFHYPTMDNLIVGN